jgi:hypothetical protein
MESEERRALAAELSAAPLDVIREIVREAESFLDAQLKAALEADKRAMTLAGILGAIISVLTGGSASMIAAEVNVWPHIWAVFVLIGFFIVALFAAINAARPTPFGFVGNDPSTWVSDIKAGKALNVSLAEQASFYSKDIKANSACLDENHRCIRMALKFALFGICFGAMLEFVFAMTHLAGVMR